MAISRVLVANRGEIALRVIKACRALGIESVLAVSAADRESLPSKEADRVVCIGPARAADSYLKVEALIAAALGTGSVAIPPGYGFLAERPELAPTCEKDTIKILGPASDAILPGYGFLAERPELARACEQNKIQFIGPRPESILQMGNKLLAREIVRGYGIPVIPGSEKVHSFQEGLQIAKEIGLPILIKAAAGDLPG